MSCTLSLDDAYSKDTMHNQHSLSSLVEMHIDDVSKTKIHNDTIITQIKSLNYHTFTTLINQFIPDILCISTKGCRYISIGSQNDASIYKDYPINITKNINTTQITAIDPMILFDNIVCLNNQQIVFVPIIGEYITYDRKLHQMTLIFDINKHSVFLHDPNSRSLFNDDITIILLQEYVNSLNIILHEYGMSSYTFKTYVFDNMNVNVNFWFAGSIKGNCVVASMVFMMLYQKIQNAVHIETILQQTDKEEYKTIYIGMYNKLQEYIYLIT